MRNVSDRDMAIQIHSDCWKDCYGTRPRKNWAGISTAHIEAETQKLSDEIEEICLNDRMDMEQATGTIQGINWAADLEFNIKYGAFEDRWERFQNEGMD